MPFIRNFSQLTKYCFLTGIIITQSYLFLLEKGDYAEIPKWLRTPESNFSILLVIYKLKPCKKWLDFTPVGEFIVSIVVVVLMGGFKQQEGNHRLQTS